jgi:hypothetical protein
MIVDKESESNTLYRKTMNPCSLLLDVLDED